ncbi:MAG TPA: TetR/AcrR family transcriptional regulator [Caulobacteraceae bacterium]
MTMILNKPRKSARKAKGDGHLRRAEILAAAERIFVAQGYEGATIRKIADEVGVSSTALYMHFKDKDEILLEICTEVIAQLLTINSEISVEPIDSVARVRRMLEAYIHFGLSHPNAYRLAFCSSPLANSLQKQEATNQMGANCFERFVGVVREIAAEGRLRCGDARTAAQTLWAACHGLTAMIITKPSFDWAEPDDIIKVMMDSLLYGMIAD